MSRILLIEGHERSLRTVRRTLAAVDIEPLVLSDKKRIKLELRAEQPSLIICSADWEGGGGLDLLRDVYTESEEPAPVIAYSRKREPSDLLEDAPIELHLIGALKAPLDPGGLVRLVAAAIPSFELPSTVSAMADLVGDAVDIGLRLEEPEGRYELSQTPLPRLLCAVDEHDWTGCFSVDLPRGGSVQLWFEFGQLVVSRTNLGRDLIGTAVAEGRLDPATLPDVELRGIEDEVGLLMAYRAIGMHQVADIEQRTAVRLVEELLDLPHGELDARPFEETDDHYSAPLAVLPLLLDAIGNRAKRRGELQAHPDSVLIVRLPADSVQRSWALGPRYQRVLDHLGEARGREITLRQFANSLPDGEDLGPAVSALLTLLQEVGFVEISGRPWDTATTQALEELVTAFHHARRADYFEVLHVPLDADDKVVRKAINELSRKYHPDTWFEAHPRVHSTATALFARIQEAYEVLGDAERRAEYREQLEGGGGSTRRYSMAAKVAVARGKLLLRNKRYEEAWGAFRDASLHDPQNADGAVLKAWATYLVDPKGQGTTQAISELKDLLKADEGNPDAWYYLGRLHLLAGKHPKARKYFGKALKIDPEHVDALRETRLMDRRGQAVEAPKAPSNTYESIMGEAAALYGDEDGEDKDDNGKSKSRGFFSRLRGD